MEDLYGEERREMVRTQIERRGLCSPRLLATFQKVPRHEFVPPRYRHRSYADGPLPIGKNQTISQPYIVALMTSLLDLTGSERVLEIGTGSGYQAAILSLMAKEVHSVERYADLAEQAAVVLARLGMDNVHIHCADGSMGWAAAAPYPAILITAAAAQPPPPVLDQLSDGGRLVIPVGGLRGQVLQVWTRSGEKLEHEDIIPVSFVPLRGVHGWEIDQWPRSEEDEYF